MRKFNILLIITFLAITFSCNRKHELPGFDTDILIPLASTSIGFDKLIEKEKICVFVNYYQFFREVLFSLKKNGVFSLLYDERSPVFNYKGKGLMPFLMEFVPDEHKNKITMISIQELVSEIERSDRHTHWIGKFKLKYGIN